MIEFLLCVGGIASGTANHQRMRGWIRGEWGGGLEMVRDSEK